MLGAVLAAASHLGRIWPTFGRLPGRQRGSKLDQSTVLIMNRKRCGAKTFFIVGRLRFSQSLYRAELAI